MYNVLQEENNWKNSLTDGGYRLQYKVKESKKQFFLLNLFKRDSYATYRYLLGRETKRNSQNRE